MNVSSIIPIFIPHVGCPNNCVFCNQKKIAGTVSAPTADDVRKEIEQALLKRHSTPPQVAFYGGSFTAIEEKLQKQYLDAVKPYIESGEVCGVRVSTRPDFINNDILTRLSESGVTTVELGIQSFDDDVLKLSGRGHTAKAGISAVECVKSNGLQVVIQIMAGLPGDTEEKALESARISAFLKPDGVRIYPVAVIKDTPLADMYRQGKYTALSIEDAVVRCSKMLEVFIQAGIDVIRIGLNPSESLDDSVIAGAYHPALGELVRSRVYLNRARDEIKELIPCKGRKVVIEVGNRYVSAMSGQYAQNKKKLSEEFNLISVKIRGGELDKWQVKVFFEEK